MAPEEEMKRSLLLAGILLAYVAPALADPCANYRLDALGDQAQLQQAEAACSGYNNTGSTCFPDSISQLQQRAQADYSQYVACEQGGGG
jgi:hypothetical protein